MQDFRQKWTGLAVKMASRDSPSVKLATYKRSLRREPWCPILTSQVAQLSWKSITPVMTWPLVACINCYSSSLYGKHLSASLEIPGKILRVIKCHISQSRAHLTVSTEQVLFQTSKSCLRKLISPFTIGLYGSLYNYVVHIALIAYLARSHASLITSFQPPLVKHIQRTSTIFPEIR